MPQLTTQNGSSTNLIYRNPTRRHESSCSQLTHFCNNELRLAHPANTIPPMPKSDRHHMGARFRADLILCDILEV